ncbi:alpha/beta fold hydrolase [Streptomyces sp. SPB162]|uniref:thioesterase II family protein n=1 Tax=Streptomyces sp. SPB162 TaxID=2940560 RepID=UPI0024062EF0|nr:alpha/beta fold hydrolase [Streptomyces sp. SPB162]MDF9815296.1 surfactin synthase thioesterase subunit [Streptomyces sp. SPB162]
MRADTEPTGPAGELGRWFLGGLERPWRDDQLLCLPHSGGNASSYRGWLAAAEPSVDVVPVQLPGRETRLAEPPFTDQPALVAELADVVGRAGFRRISLFGHSLGAVLAVNLCRELETAGVEVAHLFVSGHGGPSQRPSSAFPTDASDETLLDALRDNGAPNHDALLRYPELREMVLRVFRADLGLVLTGCAAGPPVRAPITVVSGTDDPTSTRWDLNEWAGITKGSFASHLLPGDHFYLVGQGDRLAGIIRTTLTGQLPPGPATRDEDPIG